MTHEELLARIDYYFVPTEKLTGDDKVRNSAIGFMKALRAVVELHRPDGGLCNHCEEGFIMGSLPVVYPCPTIQAIEKELNRYK